MRAAAPEISSIEVVAAENGRELRGDSGGVAAEPRAPNAAQVTRGTRCPTSPTWPPERSAASASRASRCWPAGSVTSCSPTATGADLRRVARRRGAAPPLASTATARSCGARAAARISTSCTPVPASTETVGPTAHLEPIPLLVRDGVLSHGGSPRTVACMDGNGTSYDVLARIRAARTAPQPAGERCEMCAEPIADEHQHVVNVEGRQLMCVCRGCYLLFTDTEADAALSRHPRPLPRRSRTSRWTAAHGRRSRYRSGWRSSSATRRWTGRSRSIPGRRAPPNPSWT